MLDEKILEQVKQVIGLIKYPVELATSLDYSEQSKQTSEILHQIAGLSDLIQVKWEENERKPSFVIRRVDSDISVRFAGFFRNRVQQFRPRIVTGRWASG